MKTPHHRVRSRRPSGFTLLELSVILAVLLTLVAILFVGARAWIRGSDRAACVMIQRNVQVSVRSYQNLYGYNPGSMPSADGGTQSIAQHLLDKGYINPEVFTTITGMNPCPGGGTFIIDQIDLFPPVGSIYARCSLETTQRHVLPGGTGW